MMRYRITFLAAVNLLLLGALLYIFALPPMAIPIQGRANPGDIEQYIPLVSTSPPQAFGSVGRRSPFGVDLVPEALIVPEVATESRVFLIGIIQDRGVRKALLSNEDGNTAMVAKGESYSGWTVDDVQRAGVRIRSVVGAGAEMVLPLEPGGGM